MNRSKLLAAALIKFISGLVITGVLLFWPAGTFKYPNGWLFMGLLFVPMLAVGIVLYVKAPELLVKRLNSKEKESEQNGLLAASALLFIAGFVLAGLNYRFGWVEMLPWGEIAACITMLTGYGVWAEVMRENAYLSRTVEIQKDQKVIDTGLYAAVRHPMYAAALLMFLSIPLVLGSLISFAVFLGFIPIFVLRIKNEEKVLEEGLPGYRDYEKKVRYRLLPHIW